MDIFEIARHVERSTGVSAWWPAVEPTPRWIRVRLGDTVVADSRRALLLIQYGPPPLLPTYFIPREDLADGVLVDERAVDGATRWSVQADGRRAEDAAWTSPHVDRLPELDGHMSFAWDTDLVWYDEDEPLFAHARDPHKRVDVAPSSRHVQIRVDGIEVADSHAPLMLFETTLPPRYYLPAGDVRTDLLVPTDSSSQCPYKGTARWWSVQAGDRLRRDLAWSYPDPVPENPRIQDRICFYQERRGVEFVVDGQPLPTPASPFFAED